MISLIVKFRYYDEAVVNQAIRFFRCQTLYHRIYVIVLFFIQHILRAMACLWVRMHGLTMVKLARSY